MDHASDWRPDLWERCSALQDRAYRRAGGTSLSVDELEDVWAELLAKFARRPGTTGALPADIDLWNDEQLVGYLGTSLSNAAGKRVQRGRTAAGESRFTATPLEDLAEQVLVSGALSRDARPRGPEEALLSADGTMRAARELGDLAGPEEVQLMLADAAGFSAAQQMQLMGIDVSRRRQLGYRVEGTWRDLRSRLAALTPLLWPETLLRALTGWLSTGAVPRLGAAGVAVVALVGGGVAVENQVSQRPAQKMQLGLSAPAGAPRATQAIPQVAVASSVAATRIARAAKRRQVVEQRKRRARVLAVEQRQARQRRAASTAATATGRGSVAAQEFSPAPTAGAAAPAPAPSRSRGTRPSVAGNEFEPGGR